MEMYQLSAGCLLKDFRRAWLVLLRAECSCGYVTHPCLTPDGAASVLLRHHVRKGVRVL